MIPKKYLVEIGTYKICKKGKSAPPTPTPRLYGNDDIICMIDIICQEVTAVDRSKRIPV
jgi:hypothetical protein